MIARPISRAKPIPFSCPQLAHASAHGWPAANASTATRLQVAEPPKVRGADSWTASLNLLTSAHRPDERGADAAPHAQTTSRVTEPRTATPRQSTARYDGPHSLIIRSATSGRQYRFEHPGATQVIDAVDITLMRRIEDITLL